MKAVALFLALVPGLVLARATVPGPSPGPGENVTYGYAQVLRATPAYVVIRTQVPEQRCERPLARNGGDPPLPGTGPRCRTVVVERQERRLAGYDVEYLFRGEKYMSRLDHDPGNRLRVRVSVTPDDLDLGAR